MDTTIRLHRDFKEFLKLLEENKVEYLVVGGYSAGCHGYPRPTGDLDVWVSRSFQNAERIIATLGQFGIVSEDLTAELFTLRKSIVRLGLPPYKLEIITASDGVEFDECYSSRIESEIAGTNVKIIDLDSQKKQTRQRTPYQ